MKIFIVLCLLGVSIAVNPTKNQNENACEDFYCKAGRECVLVDGEPECLCAISCPDHFKPVCGNDEKSYDNHCKLHQHACMSGHHISIEHKGYCKKAKKLYQWKKDKEDALLAKKDLQDKLINDIVKTIKKDERESAGTKPAVCFGPQRNAMRYLIVDHWKEALKSQDWYSEGMTYRESLWGWFYNCDSDKNKYLTPQELLKCTKEVAFFARPGQDNALTKELCINALIDDGDKNQDWRLDFEEFTRIMNLKYQPKEKKCSLEGKNYSDGEEINLECNHCVCAVGNWVCTQSCETETKENDSVARVEEKKLKKQHRFSIDDFDNAIDEHTLDVDHASADTWLAANFEVKKRGKQDLAKKDKIQASEVATTSQSPTFLEFDTPTDDTEDKELELLDYYDDLYEKTKSKKKLKIEKALKEIKDLQKKTKNLKKRLSSKKNQPQKHKFNDDTEEKMRNYRKVNFKDSKKEKRNKKDEKHYSIDKYEGILYKKSKWNDLIVSDNELL